MTLTQTHYKGVFLMDNNTRKLLGLTAKAFIPDKQWLSEKIIKGINSYIVHGIWQQPVTTCIRCNSKNIVRNGHYTTKTKLPDIYYRPTFLHVRCSRFICKDCKKSMSSPCDLKARGCHISKDVKRKILLELSNNVSRKYIAEQFGVSDMTVLRIMREHHKRHSRKAFNYLPKILCVDEFKSTKLCSGKMSFICVDGEKNKIFDILADRRVDKLTNYFLKYSKQARLNVQYLVMDMNSHYGQLIKTVFPNAVIVTDRFHIIQHINRNLNSVRIKIMNSFNQNDNEQAKKYRRLKTYWKLLLKDSFELDYSNYRYHRMFKAIRTETEIVDELLSYSTVLKEAYEFVQLLKYGYSERDSDFFFSILSDIPKSLPENFRHKFKVFNRYKTGIINAFSTPFSNGITEGLNNKIKVIKRVAFGYKSFYTFRLRILLIQGLFFTVHKQNEKVKAG